MAKVAADHASYYLNLVLLFVAALLALALLVRLWPLSPWQSWPCRMATAYLAAPEWAQWMWMGLSLAMYYFLP